MGTKLRNKIRVPRQNVSSCHDGVVHDGCFWHSLASGKGLEPEYSTGRCQYSYYLSRTTQKRNSLHAGLGVLSASGRVGISGMGIEL
jgi:hypothetical protein